MATPNTGRTPDYRIKATTRPNVMPKRAGVVGAGWSNPDGSISIVLEPFTTLSGGDDLIITAFPIDRKQENP